MDPVTHALTSLALSRAGIGKATRMALPMLLVSGLAADLDWVTRLIGARAFLDGRRTATHSVTGTLLLILTIALAFWLAGKYRPKLHVTFRGAVILCAIGAFAHVSLDLLNDYGVKLLWPFSPRWFAYDLVPMVDWWIIIFLLAGIFLPELFALIHEEIGSKPTLRGRQRSALTGLILVLVFIAGRGMAHERALAILGSREYRAQAPLKVGAFPESTTPLVWAGVVGTDNAIFKINVPLAAGATFNSDQAEPHFKPQDSALLRNAVENRTAKDFLNFARFPLAGVTFKNGGFRVLLHDKRFAEENSRWRTVHAVIELNDQGFVTSQRLEFDSAPEN